MVTPTPCPRAEVVARLIDGDLSPRERGILEYHLAACDECYRLLTESTEVWWRLRDEAGIEEETSKR